MFEGACLTPVFNVAVAGIDGGVMPFGVLPAGKASTVAVTDPRLPRTSDEAAVDVGAFRFVCKFC